MKLKTISTFKKITITTEVMVTWEMCALGHKLAFLTRGEQVGDFQQVLYCA